MAALRHPPQHSHDRRIHAGGDPTSAAIMVLLLAVGVGLRFFRESQAQTAVESLRTLIRIHATVLRDGVLHDLPLESLVAVMVPTVFFVNAVAKGNWIEAGFRASWNGRSSPTDGFATAWWTRP